MSPVYPTLPKLAVRDSFDDEDLSDVDDEVFIRDGRNGGLKIDDEGGVKRPLMAPRRKCKMTRPRDRKRMTCRALLAPCCYGSVALLVLLGLITLVIFAVSVFPVPLNFLKSWLTQNVGRKVSELDIAACTSLGVSTVWTRSLPKLMSESPLRSVDVNGDKIDDVIVSFSAGFIRVILLLFHVLHSYLNIYFNFVFNYFADIAVYLLFYIYFVNLLVSKSISERGTRTFGY